jgi:hypothetical protein
MGEFFPGRTKLLGAMAGLAHPEIELVIFDCDGVLIDSELISSRILIELLAEIGV